VIASRATDETGYSQPTYEVLLAARGPSTAYHFNNIRAWKILADGTVKFGGGL
jgi:sulfane dehydrogenase subunit SoxC